MTNPIFVQAVLTKVCVVVLSLFAMCFSPHFYVSKCIVFVHIFNICSHVSVVFLCFCQAQIFLFVHMFVLYSHVSVVFTHFCCVLIFVLCSHICIVFTYFCCVYMFLLCLHVSVVFIMFVVFSILFVWLFLLARVG